MLRFEVSSNFKILALSGGGVRGLFTCEVIVKLEELRGVRFIDHFDLICGTSIGGIVALGLAAGIEPIVIARKLRDHSGEIFPDRSQIFGVPSFIRNVFTSNYDVQPLKILLTDIFKDRCMKDLKTRVLIPAVNYTTGEPKVFKTPHLAKYYNDRNVSLVDVALATSAAPTYFPIHEIDDQRFVDGGLIGNSPVYFGLHEAIYFLGVDPEKLSALSIGTMGTKKTSDHRKKLNQGLFHWSKSSIELTLSASESLHQYWVSHILSEENFMVLDEKLTNDQAQYISMDNSSKHALETLSARGKAVANFASNSQKLEAFWSDRVTKPAFYKHGQEINIK